jgi:hypothetical protein
MKQQILALYAVLLVGGLVRAQTQTTSSAQFVESAQEGSVVLLDFGGPFKYDPTSKIATLADGSTALDLSSVKLISPDQDTEPIKAAATPSGSLGNDVYLNLELSNFSNTSGSITINSFSEGTRTFLIVIAAKKKDEVYTVNVAVPAKGTPRLVLSIPSPPVRNQFTVQVQNADAHGIFQSLQQAIAKIVITYDFGPDSPIPNIKTGAKQIDAPTGASSVLIVVPNTALPYHATTYKVSFQIPTGVLPPSFRVSPPAKSYSVSAVANFPSPTVLETAADYDFEPTFTSAVNKSKQTRTNTGLFILNLKPLLFVHQQNVDGRPRQYSYWTDFKPNISANVDTLPEKSSTTPNRITFALDSELGFTRQRSQRSSVASGGQPFDQLTWTNGAHTDADRDLKVFSTYWHTDVAFDPWKWSEARAFRTRNLVPAGTPSHTPAVPVITAYRFRPSFGYDLGSTDYRSGPVNSELGTSVSRVILKLDTMLEIRKNLSFSVVDMGYYLFDASRRNTRDFLLAQVSVDTGLLLRLDTNKIQSAVAFTYQRGDQPPLFTPVDTICVGLKLYK